MSIKDWMEKKVKNTIIRLEMGDITEMSVDAIVNAANKNQEIMKINLYF